MKKNPGDRINYSLILILFSFLIINSCVSVEEKNIDLTVYTEQDRQDVLYMKKLMEGGKSIAFNLADSIQYRFLKRQFELSGKTPEEYPQHFKSLEDARALHIKSGIPDERLLGVASGISGLRMPINTLTELGPESSTTYASAALSSVPGGTVVTQVTLRLFDANANPLGPLATETDMGEGENTSVRALGSLISNTATVADGDSVTAVFAYYYQSRNGTPYTGGYSVTTIPTPTSIVPTNPLPVRHTGATITKVCLGRGAVNGNQCATQSGFDCDYCYSQGSYANVFFPVSGSITYSDSVDAITFMGDSATNAWCFIDVIQFMNGGGCPILKASNNFFKDPNTVVQGKTLSWNLDPANFGAGCYKYYGDSLTFNFTVRVSVKGQPVFVSITNAKVLTQQMDKRS